MIRLICCIVFLLVNVNIFGIETNFVVLDERADRVVMSIGPSVEQRIPLIKRDITLKIPRKGLAYQIVEYINLMKISDLKNVVIVDAFQGNEEDFRRVTYRCTFQSVSRTLQHEEVDQVIGSIVTKMNELGFVC